MVASGAKTGAADAELSRKVTLCRHFVAWIQDTFAKHVSHVVNNFSGGLGVGSPAVWHLGRTP
jgi:hypothetical protein